MDSESTRTNRRHGFALVTTMLLLTLLIAVGAELTLLTSTHAVSGARRNRCLAHELAVDSAMLILADRLASVDEEPSRLIDKLDRFGRASTRLQVGAATVDCTIQDDGAKLSPLLFQRADQRFKLTRKLTTIGAKRSLLGAEVSLRPLPADPLTT